MASFSITATHPQLSTTKTITVTDARMVEFADNIRLGTNLTRAQAIDGLLADVERYMRERYKRAKEATDRAALVPPGEIDA